MNLISGSQVELVKRTERKRRVQNKALPKEVFKTSNLQRVL
jgi:hypothetical protein